MDVNDNTIMVSLKDTVYVSKPFDFTRIGFRKSDIQSTYIFFPEECRGTIIVDFEIMIKYNVREKIPHLLRLVTRPTFNIISISFLFYSPQKSYFAF